MPKSNQCPSKDRIRTRAKFIVKLLHGKAKVSLIVTGLQIISILVQVDKNLMLSKGSYDISKLVSHYTERGLPFSNQLYLICKSCSP